jgi:hypothetical protein
MKAAYSALAAVVIVGAFLTGLLVGDITHAGDTYNGWQDGYSAAQVANRIANDRLVAAGLCHYADLACTRHK